MTDEEDVDYYEEEYDNNDYPVYNANFTKDLKTSNSSPTVLIVIASRLVQLFRLYESKSQPISSVSLVEQENLDVTKPTESKNISEDSEDEDFYQEIQKKKYSIELPIYQVKENSTVDLNILLLPLAPEIPVAASHDLANTIVKQLKQINNSSLLVVSPSNGSSSGITSASTTNIDYTFLSYLQSTSSVNNNTPGLKEIREFISEKVAPLSPPQSTQGVTAAVLEMAECLQLDSVLGLVVDSEGPLDHERINPDGLVSLASVLKSQYGLTKVLDSLPSQSIAMYL